MMLSEGTDQSSNKDAFVNRGADEHGQQARHQDEQKYLHHPTCHMAPTNSQA